MKKYIYIPLFILLALALTNCQSSDTARLEATNQALVNQVNSLMDQLTPQVAPSLQPTQEPSSTSTEIILPTEIASTSPSPISAQSSGVLAPKLIFSGSGLLTPWSNDTVYPLNLFGSANVHMLCDPNDTADSRIWIDNKNYSIGCNPDSESWIPWKQDITVGDHFIYSSNPGDKYEFWTIGTPPFTIRNRQFHSDYMFQINNSGIYNLSANLIRGEFNIYITCEKAQNFDYKIIQSTTVQLVLNSARCELIIRDSPPGTVSPGEIEVSLQASK